MAKSMPVLLARNPGQEVIGSLDGVLPLAAAVGLGRARCGREQLADVGRDSKVGGIDALLVDRLHGGCDVSGDQPLSLKLTGNAIHWPGEPPEGAAVLILADFVEKRSRKPAVCLLCGRTYHIRLYALFHFKAVKQCAEPDACPQHVAECQRLGQLLQVSNRYFLVAGFSGVGT